MNYCDDLTDEQFLRMCQQDEEEVEGEEGRSSNLVVVPKRGRGRRPKPKHPMMEEAMAAVSIAYVERNEKSRSNEDEYYEED